MPVSICLQKSELAQWKHKSLVSQFELSGFNIKLTWKQMPIDQNSFALQVTVACSVQPDQKLLSSKPKDQSLLYYLDVGEASETAAVSYKSIPLIELPKEECHIFPADSMDHLLSQYGRIQVKMGVGVELRCSSQSKILAHVE